MRDEKRSPVNLTSSSDFDYNILRRYNENFNTFMVRIFERHEDNFERNPKYRKDFLNLLII